MNIETVSIEILTESAPPAGWYRSLTHTHTYSGRDDHGGTTRPPESYRRLSEWAASIGIRTIGMGSPYTPKSAVTFHRYDGNESAVYYKGEPVPDDVLASDEIADMLAQVNRISEGRTLFYLDNETPKCRYGHLWWVGYHPDKPAWHDYDQPFDRWQLDPDRPEQHQNEPMPYERRPYLEILAIQRAHGALGFWAHPSSWWQQPTGQFITNIATEMPAHAIAEGYLDGMVIMGYQPYRPEYQRIWFALLDRGYRVPGVAEMDCGLSDVKLWSRQSALLNNVWLSDTEPSVPAVTAAFRAGHLCVTSGPFLDVTVDGYTMGSVAPTAADRLHRVSITALPPAAGAQLDRIELLGTGGAVLWSLDNFPGGTITLVLPGSKQRGYLVARILSNDSALPDWREPRRVAVSNPVYLHPPGSGFAAPARTDVRLTISAASPFRDGELLFEAMDGEQLGHARATVGEIVETLPASGRITCIAPDGQRRTDYLINANPALQEIQRYLYRGRFLLDFPEARSGEIPLAAWQLDRYQAALRQLSGRY